jgi:crotonobetainyl-CoA:carnitine CoA-transferase CaiB-like acyl-CoA transferase
MVAHEERAGMGGHGEHGRSLPLAGIRVVDLTRVMTGPYATMMLGDMGAEVIKVEVPGRGDDTRSWGPPFVDGEASYFLSVNRNKRSIALDLKHADGIAALWRLIESADVVIENFSPGTAGRLGIGYDAVHARCPRVVYASISGFGQRGPGANRTAYDLIVQGMSGLMSITGVPEGQPTKLGIPIADIGGGMFAAYAVVSALFERERSGEGQYIDVSMFGGQVALLTYQAGIYFTTGQVPGRLGNGHPIVAPYDTFATADGFVNIAVGNDALWQRFCTAFGLDEALADESLKTNAGRITNKGRSYQIVVDALAAHPTAEVVRRLDAAAVPCGPILDVGEVFDDPQTAEYQLRRKVEHAKLGPIDVLGFPYDFSETPLEIRTPPPLLGQHTREILAEAGYSAAEIDAMLAGGAAAEPTA